MQGRGGTRRGSVGLDVVDAVAIVLVIMILSGSLGVLLASRDAGIVTRAQQWVRLAMGSFSLSLLSPNQAAAEAPPAKGRAAGN